MAQQRGFGRIGYPAEHGMLWLDSLEPKSPMKTGSLPRNHPRATMNACSWLLVVALAPHPFSVGGCHCDTQSAEVAKPSPIRPVCCCCSPAQGNATDDTPSATCCASPRTRRQGNCSSDHKQHTSCNCACGSRTTHAPQSAPGERSHAKQLRSQSIDGHVSTHAAPVVLQAASSIDRPVAFASASEHCIALCRLRF